jgi:arsenate reductase (thioredoxin)
MSRRHVLVLCTGNSARSVMTEAYLRRLAGDRLEVASAGTEPAAEIHPMTRAVLLEDGIDLGERLPQDYREFLGKLPVHTLIVVCDGAAKACPAVWPGMHERQQWPFEDPAALEGTEEERLAGFRRIRDQIRDRVTAWTAEI